MLSFFHLSKLAMNNPGKLSLLDELEARQDEVLLQLETLNERIEAVLKLHATPTAQSEPEEGASASVNSSPRKAA